ncbi:MAG: class I SAM-dependent methyltransferase, partial [Chloroflexi bacterium]|nr:class I SAM-dependent methyltransferase [Chloroflexota bacterium]
MLDAGAGTGLVGKLLADKGYGDIEAMDLSEGMLEEARKTGAYKAFHQMVMGEHLDLPDGAYDAVVAIGVLTIGHAPASSLDELIRVSGGDLFVVGVEPWTLTAWFYPGARRRLYNTPPADNELTWKPLPWAPKKSTYHRPKSARTTG